MISADKGHVRISGKGIEMLAEFGTQRQLCMK